MRWADPLALERRGRGPAVRPLSGWAISWGFGGWIRPPEDRVVGSQKFSARASHSALLRQRSEV
jgi:hypothetical protein